MRQKGLAYLPGCDYPGLYPCFTREKTKREALVNKGVTILEPTKKSNKQMT
jgi:hypothetical protein